MTGKSQTTQWLDYLPTGVVLLTLNTAFGAAACQNGSLNVYSIAGRRFVLSYVCIPETKSCLQTTSHSTSWTQMCLSR